MCLNLIDLIAEGGQNLGAYAARLVGGKDEDAETVRDAIFRHIAPPICMGYGRGSVALTFKQWFMF